jgi:hypothetical protein
VGHNVHDVDVSVVLTAYGFPLLVMVCGEILGKNAAPYRLSNNFSKADSDLQLCISHILK